MMGNYLLSPYMEESEIVSLFSLTIFCKENQNIIKIPVNRPSTTQKLITVIYVNLI